MNLRVAKIFTLGESGSGGKPGGRDPMELTISAQARNLLNHPNLASPVGNLSSSFFGQSVALAGGGGNSASGNRRIELQIKFAF